MPALSRDRSDHCCDVKGYTHPTCPNGDNSGEGQLQALSSKKRGRKPEDASVGELAQLQCENERLRGRLEQTEIIVDVQRKLSKLLGLKHPL